MSRNYSASQYENAFVSTRIQNWELPKPNKNHGKAKSLNNIDDRSRKFSNFVGTWDMPRKLPSAKMNVRTGRSEVAFQNLQEEFKIPREILSGHRAPEKCIGQMNKAGNGVSRGKLARSRIDAKLKKKSKSDDDDDVVATCCNGVSFDNTVSYFEVNHESPDDGFNGFEVSGAGDEACRSGRIAAF